MFNRKFLHNFLLNKNLSEKCTARSREVCLTASTAPQYKFRKFNNVIFLNNNGGMLEETEKPIQNAQNLKEELNKINKNTII